MEIPTEPIAVYNYPGRTQADAAVLYARHAGLLAGNGYVPVSQSWAEGRPGIGRYLLMGIDATVIRPKGYLTVTYRRAAKETTVPRPVAVRTPAAIAPLPGSEPGMKVCPDCAEDVRAAARICRYCRYEFPPASLFELLEEPPVPDEANVTTADALPVPLDLGRWRVTRSFSNFHTGDTATLTRIGTSLKCSKQTFTRQGSLRDVKEIAATTATLTIRDALYVMELAPVDGQDPEAVAALLRE